MYKIVPFIFVVTVTIADVILPIKGGNKPVTLKPLSVCCEIPEIGEAKHLAVCSDLKLKGPCSDVKCVFEQSGFLNKDVLNKEVYKNHMIKWAESNKGFSRAVDKVIEDCIDKEPRQHLDYPCKAYDVFTCTGIALLKKCPEGAWKC